MCWHWWRDREHRVTATHTAIQQAVNWKTTQNDVRNLLTCDSVDGMNGLFAEQSFTSNHRSNSNVHQRSVLASLLGFWLIVMHENTNRVWNESLPVCWLCFELTGLALWNRTISTQQAMTNNNAPLRLDMLMSIISFSVTHWACMTEGFQTLPKERVRSSAERVRPFRTRQPLAIKSSRGICTGSICGISHQGVAQRRMCDSLVSYYVRQQLCKPLNNCRCHLNITRRCWPCESGAGDKAAI